MKVKALVGFTGRDKDGNKHIIQAGDEFELPKGVDWLKNGLVEKAGTVPAKGKK